MDRRIFHVGAFSLLVAVSAVGCRSPYRADQGALFGGLLGAGTGALIGDALGNAGAGAAIGAGVGVLSGAVIGQELDDIEAANRAAIEQQLGRQVAAGAVRLDDVVAMSTAGVDDELIVNHIRAHGMASPLGTSDLILLQQQGVSTRVIKAMQEPPPRPQSARPVVIHQTAPPPVIIAEHHCDDPFWRPHYRPRYYYPHRRPGASWGFSFSN